MSTADEYWSIDIPGLTENEAASLQERLAGGGVSGEDKACAQGLLEDFEAWLDQAQG